MNLPQKSALYIRVSTHWQVDKDSIQIQERDLIAYSQIILGINDYEIFKDAGFSGKNTDRPKFQEMMNRIRCGEFSHLIVWKVDRVSRNLVDFANMYSELKKLGVIFVSKNEQFDTSTAIGEAMLKIILVFAELERNMTSERVRAVMLSRANEAKYNGGPSPHGYKIDPSTHEYVIDPPESEIITHIFDLYEKTKSIRLTTMELIKEGIKTRKGFDFSASQISKILKNPTYMGTYRYNCHEINGSGKKRPESEWITIPNSISQIISEEQFLRVQELLKNNSNVDTTVRTTRALHVFSGILFCGSCGNRMFCGTNQSHRKDGYISSIYRCKLARNISVCRTPTVYEHHFAPILIKYISNVVNAQKQFKKGSPKALLEKRLLSGIPDVKLTQESLDSIYLMMSSSLAGIDFKAPKASSSQSDNITQLENKKIKLETALNRLKTLFLFSEESISEKDYLLEKNDLEKQLSSTNESIRLYKLENSSAFTDDLLVDKISYYLTINDILNNNNFDYIKYITTVNKEVVISFFRKILHRVYINNKKIVAIVFNNGLIQEFIYADGTSLSDDVKKSIYNS